MNKYKKVKIILIDEDTKQYLNMIGYFRRKNGIFYDVVFDDGSKCYFFKDELEFL